MIFIRTETIQVAKLKPSDGMHLRNKLTGEVYESYIYLAKSLVSDDFIEITKEEYQNILNILKENNNIE